MSMTAFTVERTERLKLQSTRPLSDMYTLSPYVWHEGNQYKQLLRAVNHSDHPEAKVSRIYDGQSADGLHFAMGDRPVIAPGPGEEDRDGCEDPTVAIVDDTLYVYYSGWNQARNEGQLLLATGEDSRHLLKQGTAIPFSQQYQNPKEASIAHCPDGTWRLFFEYASEGASRIGVAAAPAVDGPWTIQGSPFAAREGRWDGWHLSPGPVLNSKNPVMFYNGATQDVKWRIGWIMFEESVTQVIDRCDEPVITPPSPRSGETDIAFVASAVEVNDTIYLYYSVADKDLMRASVYRKTEQ
ncbi:MAG: glycoside hydrolase family 130 protein [Chloroflexota bacterium]